MSVLAATGLGGVINTVKNTVSGVRGFLKNTFGSLINKYTGAGLTTAQKQQMEYETEMSNTAFQRQVADMQKAGLNPALLYGSGAGNGASTPTGPDVSGNGADLGSMIQLMMMGKQAKLLDAQAAKTTAEAGLTDRNTAWLDRMNQATLDEIQSRIGVNDAEIDLKEYDKALKDIQTQLAAKDVAWADRLKSAELKHINAQASRESAEAAIAWYEKQLGHRLSSSEWLALADTLCAVFGLNPKSLPQNVAQGVKKAAKTPLPDPWKGARSGLGGTTFPGRSRRLTGRFRRGTNGAGR